MSQCLLKTKQGTTTISGGGLSQTYGMANIPSQIDKIKKLTGNSREMAVIDAQKLFGADQNVLNELNKQLSKRIIKVTTAILDYSQADTDKLNKEKFARE